jgi:anhydro-N-acetylmuramic acid kinase
MFHRWIFARRGQHVCVNNLGGISNVTSLNWTSGPQPQILAFDTGPANVLLDIAMRHFTNGKSSVDRDGRWAARGQPNENILRCWLAHEFFARTPPKSTGRELFGESFFKQAEKQMRRAGLSRCDMLATLTEFTARSIALNYRLHLPAPAQKVILAGGGAANPILVQAIGCHLRELWPAVEVVPAQTMGWPLQSIEAAAFALLACLRWRRIPGNFPATTGARRPALLGQLSEP